MHSSGMRTVHCSGHIGGGGICLVRGCLPGPGGFLPGRGGGVPRCGVSAWSGGSAWSRGCVPRGGCLPGGEGVSARHSRPHLWTGRHL